MELWRLKNTDTRITFPIIDADGDIVTGAAGLDSEWVSYNTADHGGAAPSFADCTHEATEIGSTGVYYLDVSAAEINKDFTHIQIKTSTSGAKTQHILIRTFVSTGSFMAAIADAVWDEVLSGHVGATTVGKAITDILAFGAPPTPSAVADQVFDEVLSGHVTATTVGKAVTDILAFGAPPAIGAIADGVCDEVISTGHAVSNSVGKILYDNLNAPVATVDTVVDGIATDVAAILVDTGTTLDGKIDTIDSLLDDLHGTDIPAIKTVVDANGIKLTAIQGKTDMFPVVWFSP
jgi:hypothetical protein